MTYVTEQTSAELRAHMRRLQAIPGWHNPLDDRLFKEIQALDAEIAALRASLPPTAITAEEAGREQELRGLLREWQQAYNGMDRGDGILTADFQSLRRRTHEALYQPRACKPQSSTELPGMWEQADLSGGATDCLPSAPAQSGGQGNG